ncbi:LacI family DNA-binding transcriptional regulator, partial [Burkholderia cenocepacia]|uniref:LacI family DNA-binding transcriptional regulator n=1 Tax=Burkholderia cenocepacia TaxID=95486 RepID=UPI001F4AA666
MATLTMETTMAGESGPRWRKRTARFDEIAALAGVSTTTVDRVLNERGSVSAQAPGTSTSRCPSR